jgi:hypothetical protein
MLKREHDEATKENWGGPNMAADKRVAYRARRMLPERGAGSGDFLACRAKYMSWYNEPNSPDPFLPMLSIGSMYRNIAARRRATGQPLLKW